MIQDFKNNLLNHKVCKHLKEIRIWLESAQALPTGQIEIRYAVCYFSKTIRILFLEMHNVDMQKTLSSSMSASQHRSNRECDTASHQDRSHD